MCGLAGIYAPGGLDRDAGEQLRRMTDRLRHRGPDDEGWWLDAEAGIGLGARRLAIIDLSPAGPPADVLGGRALRDRLQRRDLQLRRPAAASSRPRGRASAAIRTPRCCSRRSRGGAWRRRSARCAGMFAFALWDRARADAAPGARPAGREAALLRAAWAERLLFGSELKALRDASALARRDRPRCAGAATPARLRPGAALDLPGAFKLPPGDDPDDRGRGVPDRLDRVLGPPRRGRGRDAQPVAPTRPEAVADELEALLRRTRGARDGGRRAARRLPLRRDRLLARSSR